MQAIMAGSSVSAGHQTENMSLQADRTILFPSGLLPSLPSSLVAKAISHGLQLCALIHGVVTTGTIDLEV
jgi:hypothetical protein